MSFIARLQRAREILEQQGRLSRRALVLEIGDEELDELIEELVDVQQVARREGKILVWAGTPAAYPSVVTFERETPASAPTQRVDTVLLPSAARAADPTEARKVVTIIFADLIGSTSLHERLDAESTRRLMDRYYRVLHTAVAAHGGTVVKLMGDGVMAAFGVPRVAEDDAIRAVRAGVAMQHAFREMARNEFAAVGDIGLRVGINTGEVVVSADNTDVVGDPVNVAARLQGEAHDGEVVIGESTRRLVAALVTLAPLGSFALKGRAEAMKVYRVESLDRPVGATTAAFVGRDDELGRIAAVYDAAIATPAARLAVLLGSPGLGKSRMIEEFTRRLGDAATVLTAQCDAEGGATFAPLAEALRKLLSANREQVSLLTKEGSGEVGQLARQPPPRPLLGEEGEEGTSLRAALEAAVPAADAEGTRIVAGIAALLAGSPASPEETFFVVRRFLAALASIKPVVLVIDDLHWAEPLLLDLVEHLVQWGSGVRLLVLVGARPELRDTRSSLATSGGFVTDVLTLGGLDAGAAMRLAANVIGAADLPAAVAAKVLATSEGNPLFVAELVRMLVQEGALQQEGDRWVTGVGLAALEMPPTIHALLAARIERLGAEERTVLERAAVIGRHFSRSAVGVLLPREITDLDVRLEALRRGELIEPDTGWFLGEPVLRFHHVLIRDAAYRRLLKGTRAELHECVANWIESRAPDSVEHDETLGWHLEQAHQFLGELGPIDSQGRALGERAARHLSAAGRRALARDDLPVAAGLLGRALDRLEAEDSSRAELALDWCEALLAAGDVGTAAKAIDELGRFIDPATSDRVGEAPLDTPPKAGGYSGRAGLGSDSQDLPRSSPVGPVVSGAVSRDRLRAWHTCFVGQLTVMTAPQAVHATADAVAAAAAALTALGDAAGEAKAHFVHAQVFQRLGKVGACEAALDRALAAARRAGDRRRANTVLAIAPLAALWGPSPVTRASGRCLDVVRVLRITLGAPAVEAVALSCQAVLEALRGRTDAARRMIASARKMVEDLGITQRLLEADVFGGLIDLLEGDAPAAERSLRRAYDGLRDLGLGIDAARAAALLARALLAQGRVADAEALSHESEALAGDDLKAAIAWRGVRAEALARRREHAAAVELASKAVEIAAATDALLDHADARQALAVALRAAGRSREADTEERRAIELWGAKGATLLAERARRDVPPVAPAVRAPERETKAPPVRRVRANVATASAARVPVAFAARDLDALAAQLADGMETLHHPTGLAYDREGALASFRSSMRGQDARFENEPIAALGDSLVLCHQTASASATGGTTFDVGAYERRELALIETAADGRIRRVEIFTAERLGDAIARLYQRHAELLPDEPERDRAAATARSVAAMLGPYDPDSLAPALAPAIEAIDHRTLGTWSAHGAEAFLQHFRAMIELADQPAMREDEVLSLQPDALLIRRTHCGTGRAGGGAYERPFIDLLAFGTDGLLTRLECFDADRDAEALARFVELTAPCTQLTRRVRPNEVTAFWARFDAVFATRDADAIDASFSDSFVEIDHTTGASYGRDGALASIRRLLRSPDPGFRHEALATLGPSLGLVRGLISANGTGGSRFDVGAYEIEEIKVTEVDEQRRLRSAEVFARERLGDAVARLYERHAELLPDGAARERAAARAGTLAVVLRQAPRIEAWCATVADAFELVDHRVIGVGSFHGGKAMRDNFRAMFELEEIFALRVDDVLAARPEALLFLGGNSGVSRASGGSFERIFLQLWVMGSDGQLERIEYFEAERRAEALARFDELVGSDPSGSPLGKGRIEEGSPAVRFANAATGFCDRFVRAWAARDWDAVTALHSPAHHNDDRRRLMQMRVGADTNLTQLRTLFEMPRSRMAMTSVATRDERLALSRILYEGDSDGGGGTLAIDYLGIIETNGDGRLIEIVLFDLYDLDAAYAELDARWIAGEASVHPRASKWLADYLRHFTARDWEAMSAICAPDLLAENHRLVGWGTLHGPAAVVSTFQTQIELAPDTQERVDHVRMCEHAVLFEYAWHGTRDGGVFENLWIVLIELDADGRARRADVWEAEQLEKALARFEALVRSSAAERRRRATPIPPNTATRVRNQLNAAFMSRDWDAMRRLARDDLVFEDRRKLSQTSGSVEMWIKSSETVQSTASGVAFRDEMIGTVGDRIELRRRVLTGAGPDGGGFESELIVLTEVDADGRLVASINLDIEARAEAFIDAQNRFTALPSNGCSEGFANAATATLDPVIACLVAHDWQGFEQLFAEDFHMSDRRRLVQLELDRDQYVAFTREVGDGRTTRGDWKVIATRGDRLALTRSTFEYTDADVGPSEIAFLILTQVDDRGRIVAYVRWDLEDLDAATAELAARWEAGEAAAHPLASRWIADYARFFAARDWNAMAAIMAPDLVSQSHRLVSWGTLHGPEGLVSTMQAQMELAPDTQLRVDHVRTCAGGVLMEYAWYGTRDGGAFENVLIAAVELDAHGRARRIDVWEAEQLEQARARFGEIAQGTGADDANAVYYASSVDRRYIVGTPPYQGGVRGGLAGQLLERPPPSPLLGKEGGYARQTAPDPLRIPPNASTRANDRWWACVEAGDWDALRPLIEPIVFEDRRRLIRITGGAELLLADSRHIWEIGLRPTRTLLSTAGDRLSLERMLWSVSDEGQRSEIDVLKVCEVDREGRIVAYLIFDADDRAAASAELVERYARSSADEAPAAWFEFWRAWNDHDLARLRTLLPDDYYFHDHRRTGIGRVEGEAYIASLAALYALSRDVRLEPLYWVARADHGGVGVMRWVGTNAEGGEFEAIFAGLSLYRGERPIGAELFEIADLDAALARFEELGAAKTS